MQKACDAKLELALASLDDGRAAGGGNRPHTYSATSGTHTDHRRTSIAGWAGWKSGQQCGGRGRMRIQPDWGDNER
jgi:hypothetical protein